MDTLTVPTSSTPTPTQSPSHIQRERPLQNDSVPAYFTDDGFEYVIRTPHPPRDWYNYLWNEHYLASVSQNLNGNSLYQNEAGVVTNLFGKQDDLQVPRTVILRDRDTSEYWSASYRPCASDQEEFECRHGLGYSVLNTERNGISTSVRVFVPLSEPAEIWTIQVKNSSPDPRRISLFTACDIALDGKNMPYGYISSLRGQRVEDGFLFFQNTSHNVVKERYKAVMATTREPDGWECSREAWLGKYRNPARPEAVERGQLENGVASVQYLLGAFQHDLDLAPGAETTVHVIVGLVTDLQEGRRLVEVLTHPGRIEEAFAALHCETRRRVAGLELDTPDPDFNRLMNVWMKHQLFLMADWARFYFKGYRDTCQDAAGMSVLDPSRARAMLKKALAQQRSDGFCPRAFRVPSMDVGAADKHYADSPSWISHAADAILRETGDLSFLEETVPYSDQGADTVWGHILRAMEFLWADRGAHGLSLIHAGDWCDLLDKVGVKGKGESVWMSFALARVLRITGAIATWRGDTETATLCQARFRELSTALQTHGWDGQWFLAAINDEGQPIGSHANVEGSVFINPQSWAMLSGVIDSPAYTRIATTIEPMVDTPVGPVHNWPPFTAYQEGIGQLSGTPPGFFTNGNVYCHAASFKIAADFLAGRHDKAFDTLSRILPHASRSEPYAQANGYVGPTALRRVRHVSDDPWRTGTVAWNFLNVVDMLLGFGREPDGLRFCPRLPSHWETVRYLRPFRGTLFEVEIRKGDEAACWVEGERLDADFLPVPPEGLGSGRVHVLCVQAPNCSEPATPESV